MAYIITKDFFMNSMRLFQRGSSVNSTIISNHFHTAHVDLVDKKESKRLKEFRKKLRETTSIDDLGEQPLVHPAQKDDPLPPWPDNTNPHTGEVGGPRGPEPTRYGDWERKGRVTDF